MQVRRNGFAGFNDERNIRLAVFVERRGHANDDRFDFPDAAEIAGRGEPARLHRLGNGFRGNVLDIAATAIQQFHLGRINVQTKNRDSRPREL